MIILAVAMIVTVSFIITLKRGQQIMLIHKCYYVAAALLLIWIIAIMAMGFYTAVANDRTAATGCDNDYGGGVYPRRSLVFSICYTREFNETMPRWIWCIFIIPALSTVMIYTNPLHHLYYIKFALENSQVRFGPYFLYPQYIYLCLCGYFRVFDYPLCG